MVSESHNGKNISLTSKTILVTGGAGFIGSNLIDYLIEHYNGCKIINIDNFDIFYHKSIKEKNVESHYKYENYLLLEIDINDQDRLNKELNNFEIDIIIHLAAKAGVRPSIDNPSEYFKTNVIGTLNLLEIAKNKNVKKFIFASSSSVYGKNPNVPWSEDDLNLQPISPYAASKIAAEKVCQTYSHLYGINISILRFFTVYGPRQRPDLAIHKFYKLTSLNKPIPFYGDGSTQRDYTYITDIIKGIESALYYKTTNFEVFNIGNNHTVTLNELLNEIQKTSNKIITIKKMDKQTGDVDITYASLTKSAKLLNYCPRTDITNGLEKFYVWFNNSQSNNGIDD